MDTSNIITSDTGRRTRGKKVDYTAGTTPSPSVRCTARHSFALRCGCRVTAAFERDKDSGVYDEDDDDDDD